MIEANPVETNPMHSPPVNVFPIVSKSPLAIGNSNFESQRDSGLQPSYPG